MARTRDTNTKSASLKGKIRDLFGPKPKPQDQSTTPPTSPVISRPTRIGSQRGRRSCKSPNDENALSPVRDSLRQRADSNASQVTIHPRGLKRQGSNDTIQASPSKRTSLAPKVGILTTRNKSPSGGNTAAKVTFDEPTSDQELLLPPKRHTRGIRPLSSGLSAPPITTNDFWKDDESDTIDVLVPEVKSHYKRPIAPTLTLGTHASVTKTHRRSNAKSFLFTELDELDEDDEVLAAPKKLVFGEDSRRTEDSRLTLPKRNTNQPPSAPGKRTLQRTNSFIMASPIRDPLDDTFDACIPDVQVTTLDANAPYDDRATDIREVGQVFRVFSMPLPSRALGARSPSRVSSYGTNPLTSRFNTTLIPCQNEIALWDHSPNDTFIWSGIICIEDKDFKSTGFELRVPIKNIDIEFRSVDDNAKTQRVNGKPSHTEDSIGRPPAEFSVFYKGHSAPQSRIKTEVAEHRGICIESAWRTGPFSLLSTDLEVPPPPKTSYALRFYVPIPARLFTTGRESRYFNVRTKVTMGDYNLPLIPTYSGVTKVLIEHLRKDKHMDAMRGLPLAHSRTKAGSW